MTTAESARPTWPWAAVVALAAVAVYANAFGHDFVFDDIGLIVQNERVHSLARLRECFTTTYWGEGRGDGLYRPLVLASLALNHAIGGLETAGYTLVNVALHAAVSVLVQRLVLSLGGSLRAAVVAGLLFAVHPLHTEVVDAVVGRAESLCALFALGCLLVHRRIPSASRSRWPRRAAAAGLLALALLSKENAITLLLVLPVMDVLLPSLDARGEPAPLARRARADYPLYAAVALAYLLLRQRVVGGFGLEAISALDNPLARARTSVLGNPIGATELQRFLTAIAVLAEDLRLLVWPARLSADYSRDAIPLVGQVGDPRFLKGLAVLVAAAAGAISLRRKQPVAAFGLAFAALTLSIASNLVVRIGTILGERLLYLPSAGFVLLAAAAWDALASGGGAWRKRAAWTLLALALALGAIRTWTRNADWRSERALWESTVRAVPRSAKASCELGKVLWRDAEAARTSGAPDADGLSEEAASRFELAIAIHPEYTEAADHLADLRRKRGDLDAAIAWYGRSLALRPEDVATRTNYGTALAERAQQLEAEGRTQSALETLARALAAFDEVIRRAPGYGPGYYNRAVVLTPSAPRRAAQDLRKVLELNPRHPRRAHIESEIARLEQSAP